MLAQVDDTRVEVGRVYLEVGNHFVLMMPDGHLISVPQDKTTPTDRPFIPIDKKALAKQLKESRFSGFRTRDTKRYLYVYNTSEEFATATSRILETMYPALSNYCRRWKVQIRDPEFPLVVVMFRTEDEFQRYRKMPDGMVAYYNGISNHVVMFEQSRLTEVAPELAFKQSVSTIAHEGVHQILHNIGVQQRLSTWPIWFSEGLAEYFAPTDVDKRIRWKGVGIANDLRLHELAEFYRARDNKSTEGELVRQTVDSTALDSLGYATSWALVSYMAKFQREKFADCIREASQLKPLQSMPPASLFAKYVSDDYAKSEASLISYLKSLPYTDPIANQTHYVLMITKGNRHEVKVTPSPAKVVETQRARGGPGVAMQIQAFPNRVAAEQFAQIWLQSR